MDAVRITETKFTDPPSAPEAHHMSREEEIKKELYENTLSGRAPVTEKLTQEGIDLGMDPLEILFQALIPALQEVGRLFEVGEYFVPEMMISAKAMQRAMAILQPILGDTGVEPVGKVLMLTVKGDVHDIGKNLCIIMLEGAGFEVIDMGVNVSPERLLDAVIEHQPQLVGFSAFLTTTMPYFKTNIEALEDAGLRDKVKVMVGRRAHHQRVRHERRRRRLWPRCQPVRKACQAADGRHGL